MNATPERTATRESAAQNSLDHDVEYFSHEAIMVTDRWLDVRERRYPVAELHNVRIVHARHGELTRYSTQAIVLLIVVIARVWERLDTAGWIGALTVLAIPVALALAGLRRRQRTGMLTADVHGRTTAIVAGADRQVLEQVALAIECAKRANAR